ncbi:MAG: hypothetical protein ACOY3L_07090 [Pseudomonadota bacterium]
MKRLVLILLVLLLLGGGGAAGWWFFLRKPPAEIEQAAAPAPTAPVYLNLPAFTVPVIRDGQLHGLVTVEMAFQMKDEAALVQAKALAPLITDRLYVALYDLIGRRLMQERNFDLGLIKARLLLTANKAIGKPDAATDVSFPAVETRFAS